MMEGAGSVARRREDAEGFILMPHPTDPDMLVYIPVPYREIGIVPFLVGRGYSLRSIAKVLTTRSFGCISLLELEGA
jgi:hypothetical protein